MNWTPELQMQFDTLRAKELAGTLTDEERQQLEVLVAQLEAEEAVELPVESSAETPVAEAEAVEDDAGKEPEDNKPA